MMEPAGTVQSAPRAFLRVAGVTLARHQLGIALALECRRIICIARNLSPELIALQHDAEQAGAQFHVVPGPRALGGLVTANDDVIALADGLLASSPDAVALLEAGPGVLVQPGESGMAAGFERIDIDHSSAGCLRVSGGLVERLNELPPDCDPASALTRIALQSGVPMREVPAGAREGVRWTLVRDEASAHASEGEWIRLHIGERGPSTPGGFLARLGVLSLGAGLLHGGSGSLIVTAAMLVTLLMALGAEWLGFAAPALLLLAVAGVGAHSVALLERIERQALNLPPVRFARERILGWAFDVVLIAVLTLAGRPDAGEAGADLAFAPLMLVGLLQLLQRALDRRWTSWLEDRTWIAAVLAIAALGGVLGPAVKLLALALLAAGLLVTGRKARLT